MRKILSFIVTFVLFFLFSFQATAATLQVTKIGSLDLGGQMYSEWWYSGTNPTLYGTATASSDVTITIDSVASTATADASGGWQLTPTTLTQGDHTIVVTSSGETVSFTLHVGQAYPGTSTTAIPAESTPAVSLSENPPTPVTGANDIVLMLLIATVLITTGYIVQKS